MSIPSMITAFQIKTLPPKLDALASMIGDAKPEEIKILPIMNSETREFTYPNYLVHHKFSLPLHIANSTALTEISTYNMIIQYLLEVGTPAERLQGDKFIIKTGSFGFKNDFGTVVRFWQSKKVGKKVIYEVSVVGYPKS